MCVFASFFRPRTLIDPKWAVSQLWLHEDVERWTNKLGLPKAPRRLILLCYSRFDGFWGGLGDANRATVQVIGLNALVFLISRGRFLHASTSAALTHSMLRKRTYTVWSSDLGCAQPFHCLVGIPD